MERQSGGIRLRDENGLAYGIKHVNNKPRVSSIPYLYDIAEGNVAGHEIIGGFGARDDVQVVAGGSDLWSGAAAVAPLPPDVGEQMSLVSTSDEDGAGTLTGILSVSMHYLDAAGVSQNETVVLAGTTPVHTTAVNIRFVQSVHALTTGSAYQSVGRITLYKFGSAATVYQAIEIGGTVTLSAKRMVPAGKTVYITGGYATASDSKVAMIRLKSTDAEGVLVPRVFISKGVWYLYNSVISMELGAPIVVPSLSIIKLMATIPTGKAGAYVSAGWHGWVE